MEVFYITILTIFAAGVGTLSGFGSSTIMVPVLLLFLPLPPTLLLVGIIHWFGDLWKIVLFRKGVQWKLIILFGFPGVILTFLGARLVFSVSQMLLSQILGGFLVAYVLYLFINPSFKFKQNALTAVAGGALSGFFAGIFGVGGAIRGMVLSAFELPKEVYLATAGLVGLTVDLTRLITYVWQGTRLTEELSWGLLFFIPASFVGARLAKKIVDQIPQKQFRLIIAVFLFLIGLKLLIFPS